MNENLETKINKSTKILQYARVFTVATAAASGVGLLYSPEFFLEHNYISGSLAVLLGLGMTPWLIHLPRTHREGKGVRFIDFFNFLIKL